jgi:hypothetical protein
MGVIVRMWEVRGHPGRFADLVSWVCETAVPSLELDPGHVASEVFASADHRLVVISRWRGEPRDLPRPPSRLVAREPHAWDFTPVDR